LSETPIEPKRVVELLEPQIEKKKLKPQDDNGNSIQSMNSRVKKIGALSEITNSNRNQIGLKNLKSPLRARPGAKTRLDRLPEYLNTDGSYDNLIEDVKLDMTEPNRSQSKFFVFKIH